MTGRTTSARALCAGGRTGGVRRPSLVGRCGGRMSKHRWRLLAAALVTFLTAGLIAVLAPPAQAALGDIPLMTWNMEGETTFGLSLWTQTVARRAAQVDVLALQEVGPTGPPPALGTVTVLDATNGLRVHGGLPIYGNARQVRQYQWDTAYGRRTVYFLQTDRNNAPGTDDPTYVGG